MYNFIRSKNKRIETTNHFTDNLEKLVHITRKKKRKKQLQSYHRLLYTEYNELFNLYLKSKIVNFVDKIIEKCGHRV